MAVDRGRISNSAARAGGGAQAGGALTLRFVAPEVSLQKLGALTLSANVGP